MADYEIFNNAPLDQLESRYNATKYPFGKMEVLDYFIVPMKEARKVRSAANMYGKRKGMTFKTRKTIKDGKEILIVVRET